MAKKLVIVESPAKAKTIAGYLGPDFVVESSIGHIRDLPNRASDVPKEQRAKYGTMGVAIDDDFEPLYVVDADKKAKVNELKKLLKGVGRAPARDGRRPRGRGDRLAPAAGAEAEGAGPPDGLPRDHEGRDPARARRDARRRPAPGRRPGDAPHPRSPLRLRSLARALEEGHAGPLGRPRAVGRGAARRRARARAARLRLGRLLGHPGRLRPGEVRRPPRSRRRQARGAGARLRAGRDAEDGRSRPPRRDRGSRARGAARGRHVRRPLIRREAVHAPAGGAVHDLDAAAGGEPKAALHGADHDAGRPAPVRERLHHLHAHRLDDAVGVGARGGAQAGGRAVRSRVDPGAPAPVHAQGEERAGGARGDPAGRRRVPDAQAASSAS